MGSSRPNKYEKTFTLFDSQALQNYIGDLPVKSILSELTDHPTWDLNTFEEQKTAVRSRLTRLRKMAWGNLLYDHPELAEAMETARLNERQQQRQAVSDKQVSASLG